MKIKIPVYKWIDENTGKPICKNRISWEDFNEIVEMGPFEVVEWEYVDNMADVRLLMWNRANRKDTIVARGYFDGYAREDDIDMVQVMEGWSKIDIKEKLERAFPGMRW